MQGKDIALLVQEDNFDRVFDKIVARKLAICKVVSRIIFKPLRKKSEKDYNLYLFLTPTTYRRIMITRAFTASRKDKDDGQAALLVKENKSYMQFLQGLAV